MKRSVLAVMMLLAVACVLRSTASASSPVTGTWGSEQALLTATESGAEIEFACALGRIERPVELDRQGRFSSVGVFIPQTHGPVRDDVPHEQQVIYEGRVDQDTMALTVRSKDKKVIASYTLKRGAQHVLTKCR